MKIFDKIKSNLHQFIFLAALSISECYYLSKTVFDINSSFVLSFFAVLSIITLVVLIVSLPQKFSLSIFGLIAVAIVYLIFRNLEVIGVFISHSFSALTKAEYVLTNSPLTVLFSLALIFLLINFLIIILADKSIISAIISIVLVCFLYFTYDYINIFFTMFYVAVLLIILVRFTAPQVYKDDDNKGKFLIPFAAILVSALIIAPVAVSVSNLRPEPLKWVDEIELFKDEEPNINPKTVIRIDGQSKLTDLNEQFTYSDSKMMLVTSSYMERLRNKTYDTYTKEGWLKSQEDNAPNKNKQYDIIRLKEILNENNIPNADYTMTVELVAQSQMIFAPLHSNLTTEFETEVRKNPYDDLYMSEPLIEGTIYTLDALHIDYMSNEFIEFITKSKSENIDNIENYLYIPENLKNNVRPLTLELVKNANSNYEKAKIIESYLSTQYTYNTAPPEKPANEDYVEYFLFETKEGFCTHYASAMVVMLRSIDIPCRYVTGYMLDVPKMDGYIPDEIVEQISFTEGVPHDFSVLKENSHAWVEVWFDDLGWLAYEPTSKYTSNLGFGFKVDYADFDFEMEEIEEPVEEEKTYKILFIILGSILLVTLILIISLRIYIISKRTDREKIALIFKNIQRMYYKKRKVEKENETAREFYLRADKDNEDLHSAVTLYETALFSPKDIVPWQLIKMKRLQKKIKIHIKNIKKVNKG